jgi:TonB family protein
MDTIDLPLSRTNTMTAAKAIRAALIFCVMSHSMRNVATAQDVGPLLKQQYEGKILVLRHALQGNSQEYDSDGKVRKGGTEGPWTLYGRIKMDEVELSPAAIVLKGHRVDYKYDSAVKQLAPFPNKTRMQLTVSLARPPATVDEANEVLGRVFALTKKDVVESAPEFWRAYLDRNIAPRPAENLSAASKAGAAGPDAPTAESTAAVARQEKIGPGVSAPRPIYTPEPEFPEIASKENFQGIVVLNVIVDEGGKISRITLVRPQGMGMEEAAIAAVQKWRFKPALKNGQPVAVEMNIEVAFNKF